MSLRTISSSASGIVLRRQCPFPFASMVTSSFSSPGRAHYSTQKANDGRTKDRNNRKWNRKGPRRSFAVSQPSVPSSVTQPPSIFSESESNPTYPSLETARAMALHVRQANNDVLLTAASMGQKDALAEVLKRHIMATDGIEYPLAQEVFRSIQIENRKRVWLHTLPNKLGLTVALVAGAASFPLVFDESVVHWFNEAYVTADIPEPKDLETSLEVGSWAWNWMEPPLGTASFVLLCLQFARSQLQNLGMRPLSAKVKSLRAERLVREFPAYDAKILKAYSKADDYYNNGRD